MIIPPRLRILEAPGLCLANMKSCDFFHLDLLLLEKSSLKKFPFHLMFLYNDNSKRRICNHFKRYLCFFSIEVSQGWQLTINIISVKWLFISQKSWVEYWGWDNRHEYRREAAVNVCYQYINQENSHLFSKLLNLQRSWFPYVVPLLPLIVIPCSVSMFDMAVSAVHQLTSISLMEFRWLNLLLIIKGSLLMSAIFFSMNKFKRAFALRTFDKRK